MPDNKSKIRGKVLGSEKAFKKSLKRRSNQFLKRIGEDGLNVRFLQEPEHWVSYKEHYDEDHEPRYFPCVTGECDGCLNVEGNPSNRYLANVLDIDDEEVVPLVIPVTLARELEARYNRYSTIMDRDYELTKDGSGLDTTYSSFNEGPTKRAIKKYEPFDLLDVLASQLSGDDDDEEDLDEDSDEDEDTPKTSRKSLGGAKRRGSDSDVAQPRKKVAKKTASSKAAPAKKSLAKKTPAKKALAKKRK